MNFEALWRQRLKSILEQIATGETDYEEVANLAEHIGADYHGRFLVELLQNAEDQTTKAGKSDGLAIVVRTETHVGVLNQGLPFDDAGVRSITSAGISPKKAEESIGNKGVGFKAVFQVSSTPEIYSAVEGAKLTAAERVGFRINHDLFGDRSLRERMKATAHEVLCGEPDLERRLESRFGHNEMWSKLLGCLKRAAPFKFPQSLGNDDFAAQCELLSVPIRLLDRMSTLVVLPLIGDEKTSRVVEQALDELVAADDIPGSALLFLRGISRLRVYDHVRECAWLVSRRQHEKSCRLANGATIVPICTTSACVDAGEISRTSAEWWQIRRQFGREGDDTNSQSEEAARIEAAVARLPAGLREVRTAYASAALPRVPSNQSSPEGFPVAGRMCIGLPSRMTTGTSAWLDGPFHGNVARTDIDLGPDSQPYNRLIFEACITLFWQAVEHVKAVGGIGDRRGILFWFASEQGALTTHFESENMLSSANIVLSRSGDGFLAAGHLRLPEDVDGNCFESLFGRVPNLECFGFRLPDPWLLREGRKIIDSLTGQPCCTVPLSTYVDRSENGNSLIEVVSRLRRDDGPEWWEPFLDWLTERLQAESLRDQAVLPVVGGKLACPDDRVFLRPHGLPIGEDATGESDEDEESIDDLDPTLAESLRLLDEGCVRVRVANRPRDLTDLARRLSPDGTAGLVRRPRRPELINDVLAPALRERVQQDPCDTLCAKLLACIGEWLGCMGKRERTRVYFDRLLAPTANDDSTWVWRPAEEVYLGTGWMSDPDQEQLLERAYGHRTGTRLPSWDDFWEWIRTVARPDGEPPNCDAWRRYMKALGVHAQPRILVDRPRQGYFKSWSYSQLSVEDTPPCPFPPATALWSDYLKRLCQRPVQTCTGQVFFARPLSWIDGLEDPDIRESVMEMVFRCPEKYEQYITTNVQRQNGSDQRSFPSLWMWAIQMERWAVVPSNDGPKPINAVWILHSDQRHRRFVDEKFLVWLPEEFNRSHTLITALGVHSPDDAPIERIALELHQAAERLPAGDRSEEQVTRMLVQTLYEWLHERCENHEAGNSRPDLACLLERPVPLMKGERVESVDLKGGSCVYLNDDPQRSPHIADFAGGYALPLSAKSGFKALFDGLQDLLGSDRVRRVSQEPIDLEFSENVEMLGGRLLDLIEQSLGASPDDIELQFAALIAFGRSEQPMDPAKQAFRDHWNRIRDCRVLFGSFPAGGPANEALFDRRASAGPTLYIVADGADCDNADRRGVDLVRQSWRVVGPGHRDAFEAFAGVLMTGRQREFLRERGIGDAEWDEIQTAIGASLERGRTRLRVVAFARWRRRYPRGTVSEFESEWEMNGEPVANVSRFFDVDDATARARLNDARSVANDEEEAKLAEDFDVTTAEWQVAREQLGLERVRFSQTVRGFTNAVRWVAGAVAVAASRYVRLEANSVRSAVDEIRSLECPVALAETPAKDRTVLVEVLRRAAAVVEKKPPPAMMRLAGALRRQADQAPDTVQRLVLRGVPRRELYHVVDNEEFDRARMADEAIQSVLYVAEALAEEHGEMVNVAAVRDDARVLRHTKGWWANAFAALRVLKRAIARQAPQTARMLARERAFAALRSRHELWKAFAELGNLENDALRTPSPPKRQILGLEKTSSEIEADLVAGGDGEIERKLCQYVHSDLDLSALARRERVPLGPDSDVRRPGGTGGWRTTQRRDEDELVGYLGERFVHEHLMTAGFPDFDTSCWVSENRGGYKGQTPEPIIFGCDFRYRDIDGRFTGRDDAPLCFIEVKATTGDGGAPFPITSNEWRLAQDCHDEGEERVYVIIRVRQVQEAPEIFDVIVDPVKAFQDGWLRTRDKDLYLVVGHAVN